MADGKIVFEITVSDGSGLKLARKDVELLGTAVERTGRSHKAAEKEAKNYYNTQEKGIIGVGGSTRGFSKLAETIGRGQNAGLVGAYATLAANIFAVTAAFSALRNASQVEQILRGLEAAGTRTGQSLLNTASALKEVTGNAINTEQAMRSTAVIISAGFNDKAVTRLGQAARDTSFALGRSMTDSLDRLTRGIVKLEPELLDELGLMTKLTESNVLYAQKLGKTESQLSSFEKRQGFLNAVLSEAELKFGGLSDAAGNSTNFDKLAATFVDLSNTVLNAINVLAKPLAGILASSFPLLLSVGLLFASTLKNQLAPGFLASADGAAKAAAKFKEAAKEQQLATEAARDAARQQNLSAVAQKANFDNVGNKAPKAYANLRESIVAGTQAAGDYDKAITSLGRSIRANEALMKNNPAFAEGTPGGDIKKQDIANANAEIAAITTLRNAREAAKTADIEGNKEVILARRQAAITATLASREEAAATALNAASNYEYRKTLDSVKAAAAEHRAGLTLSAEAGAANAGVLKTTLTPALITARTNMYAFALSAKAAGIALLNAIPIIGQVLFVLGLLNAAWEAIKPESWIALEKAMDAFNETATNAVKIGDELARVSLSQATAAQRAAAALTIQSNAVRDIAEKYADVIAKAELAGNDSIFADAKEGIMSLFGEDNQKEIASFTETLFGGVDALTSYNLSIRKNSELIKTARAAVAAGGDNEQNRQAIQTLNSLNEAAPDELEKWVKMHYGSWQRLNAEVGKNPKLLQAIAQKASGELSSALGAGAEQVKSFQEAFKQFETDLASFYKSAAISTPFDQIVKSAQNANSSIIALQQTYGKGGDWKALLTGIDSSVKSSLSSEVQKAVAEYVKADALVQELVNKQKELAESGGKLSYNEQSRLKNAREILGTGEKITDQIITQLRANEELYINAQNITRQNASRLQLLQAEISANSDLYKAGAAGMRAKIADEERVRAIQKAQLQIQIDVLQSSVELNKSKITGLQLEIKNNEELLKSISLTAQLAVQNERAALASKGIGEGTLDRIKQSGGAEASALVLGKQVDKETQEQISSVLKSTGQLDKLNEDLLKKKIDLNTAENASRDILASIEALSTQIAAINKASLTEEEKRARYQRAELEFRGQSLTNLTDQRARLRDINTIYEEINIINSGNSNTLANQLDLITKQAVVARQSALDALNTKKRELDTAMAEALAARNRAGLTKEQKMAADALVSSVKESLDIAEQSYNIDIQHVNATEERNRAQKLNVDLQKAGLEWQQDALSYTVQQLEVQKSLSAEMSKTFGLRLRLAAKKDGVEVSKEAEAAIEIEAAARAYKLAVEEFKLKSVMIDLQYALLDAQRMQLREEMMVRRAAAADNPALQAQIDRSLEALNIDLGPVAEQAKRVLEQGIENLGLELETAMTRSPRGSGLSRRLANITRGEIARRQAREMAEEAKNTKPIDVKRAALDTPTGKNPANAGLIAVNEKLIGKITEWIQSIDKTIGTADAVGTQSANKLLASAQKYLGLSETKTSDNKQLRDLFKEAGQNIDPKMTAWCAAFVNAVLAENNLPGTGKLNARSFLDYGSKAETPQVGDIVVLKRGKGNITGHVGFYAGEGRDGKIKVTGGNQGNKVSTAEFDKKDVLDYRRVTTSAIADSSTEFRDKVVKAAEEVAQIMVEGTKIDRSTTPQDPGSSGFDHFSNIPKAADTLVNSYQTPQWMSDTADMLDSLNARTSETVEQLKELGPQGEVVVALYQSFDNVSNSVLSCIDTIGEFGLTSSEGLAAAADVLSTVLSSVQSITAATAAAKTDAIDKEIAAEQRRDGKSAESVAKLAALEKKKEAIAKKQFNLNKKIMMAQAVIATATGVANALASGLPPYNIIMAGIIGAMGAAQLAVIAGTQYQSSAPATASVASPSSLSIGKRGDSVDLAKQNTNLGGELGYLRGAQGQGNNSGNYRVIGSAYGGDLPRGYGNAAFAVGEKGPEIIEPMMPMTVRPANDNSDSAALPPVQFNISTIDSTGVAELLRDQRGNIIGMLREAANANGQNFLESVDTNVYTRPNVSRL